MSTPCIRSEDLGEVAELPAGHPLRMHLESCSRCQAQWKAYQSFLEDDRVLPGTRDAEAAAALDAAIRRHFPSPRPEEARESGRSGRLGRHRNLRRFAPVLAGAAALAAVLLVGHPRGPNLGDLVLRGHGPALLHLEAPRTLPDGAVLLTWSSFTGADAYRVAILDLRLDPVCDLPALSETTMVLRPGALDPHARPGTKVIWRVIALRDREAIAASEARTLLVP